METNSTRTELGQAQLKRELDFTLMFRRFGFSTFGLVELVGYGMLYLVLDNSNILSGFGKLNLVDSEL